MTKLNLIAVLVLMFASVSFTFAQSARTASGPMSALNNSGVTGSFTITEVVPTNDITVQVTFKGFQPNSAHAGHIHSGSCEKQGGVVFPLPTAKADASGNATISWPVSHITFEEILRDPYYVNFHQSDNPPGDGIVCGNITGASIADTTAVTPNAPTGAPAAGFGNNSGDGNLNLYLLGGLVIVLIGSFAAYRTLRRQKHS